jgi:hypothetical protein
MIAFTDGDSISHAALQKCQADSFLVPRKARQGANEVDRAGEHENGSVKN